MERFEQSDLPADSLSLPEVVPTVVFDRELGESVDIDFNYADFDKIRCDYRISDEEAAGCTLRFTCEQIANAQRPGDVNRGILRDIEQWCIERGELEPQSRREKMSYMIGPAIVGLVAGGWTVITVESVTFNPGEGVMVGAIGACLFFGWIIAAHNDRAEGALRAKSDFERRYSDVQIVSYSPRPPEQVAEDGSE